MSKAKLVAAILVGTALPGSAFAGLYSQTAHLVRRQYRPRLSDDRSISKRVVTALGLAVGLVLAVTNGIAAGQHGSATAPGVAGAGPGEWLKWGYDQERSLWNKAETILSKDNVGQLTLKWKTQNATPAIDKEAGIISVSTSDGKLRGLSLANGDDRMPALDFTNVFARNWSLNLIDGVMGLKK